MAKTETREKLLLIDANSLIHRSFHALPPFRTPDGNPSGALYGLASILIKVLRERSPKYVAAAFDRPEPTFRAKEYKEYKATRAVTPSDLISQLIEAHNLLGAFGIKTFDLPGFEADDIVATMAKRFAGKKVQATILSGDLDTLQAVDGDNIVVEFPQKGVSETTIYDNDGVIKRFEIVPEKLSDYKGLVGDTSDNIPGVPGIGPKTAVKLIKEYETLQNMYEEIDGVGMKDEKLYKKLMEYKDQALLSKKLATLNVGLDIKVLLEDIDITKSFDKKKALLYVEKLGSNTLRTRIENDLPESYNSNSAQ